MINLKGNIPSCPILVAIALPIKETTIVNEPVLLFAGCDEICSRDCKGAAH